MIFFSDFQWHDLGFFGEINCQDISYKFKKSKILTRNEKKIQDLGKENEDAKHLVFINSLLFLIMNKMFPFSRSKNQLPDIPTILPDIIPESHLIVSGASNGTVKLFTVAGKCVGTFGQPSSWKSVSYYMSENSRGIVPPVLKRSCSPMSILVMRGRKMNHWNTIKTLLQSSTVGKFSF